MIQEHYYDSFSITFNLQWLKDLAMATEDVAITASEIRSAVEKPAAAPTTPRIMGSSVPMVQAVNSSRTRSRENNNIKGE